MNAINKKSATKKTAHASRKVTVKTNENALQQKVDRANFLLSKIANPEILK